jgi:hypothetical protein
VPLSFPPTTSKRDWLDAGGDEMKRGVNVDSDEEDLQPFERQIAQECQLPSRKRAAPGPLSLKPSGGSDIRSFMSKKAAESSAEEDDDDDDLNFDFGKHKAKVPPRDKPLFTSAFDDSAAREEKKKKGERQLVKGKKYPRTMPSLELGMLAQRRALAKPWPSPALPER